MTRSHPTLTFLGGVGTVTGSKILLDTGASRVLIDCGMFQGLSSLRKRNWAEPPIDWRTVDAVVGEYRQIATVIHVCVGDAGDRKNG